MSKSKLTSTGFAMPPDFPLEIHDKISGILVKYKDTHPTLWLLFGLGWRGLKNRYRATVEYNEEFTQSIKKHGNSPPFEERYKQEKALFGFFVSAISAIECFFYSAYLVGAILKPDRFPSDSKSLNVYPQNVMEKFVGNFHGEALTVKMKECVDDRMYIGMRDMRDVLSHRGELPRNFYKGGERNGMATMPTNPKDTSDLWRYDFSIDENTTATPHRWLSETLKGLASAAADFCEKNMTRKK
jgi:hypothetical protein